MALKNHFAILPSPTYEIAEFYHFYHNSYHYHFSSANDVSKCHLILSPDCFGTKETATQNCINAQGGEKNIRAAKNSLRKLADNVRIFPHHCLYFCQFKYCVGRDISPDCTTASSIYMNREQPINAQNQPVILLG